MIKKHIYFFGNGKADGHGKMKDLLGGKGAGLAEMSRLRAPVPSGFTITTEVCKIFYEKHRHLPKTISAEIDRNLDKLEATAGKRLGDLENPLLLSVRSGSKFSMPGMMDTILNLGLNDETVEGLARVTNNPRFAYDCYRRFIAMFGNVVLEMGKEVFESALQEKKREKGIQQDLEMDADFLSRLVDDFKQIVQKTKGEPFPQDPYDQLRLAIQAVFLSWNNPRAQFYRKQNDIPENIGTAVNVQMMVFGNRGSNSATGVGFTRNPATGEREFYGEYLANAQGEDVVAGIRTPKPIRELAQERPEIYRELRRITDRLEKHYKDVQDFEFTIEEGKLYMLQTRVGKRTARATVKIAVDMVKERLIAKNEAILRLSPQQMDQFLHPVIDPSAKRSVIAKGYPASPGAAVGKIIFDADRAVDLAEKGEKVLLVRRETNPDDIHGMNAAQGVLTARGGATSHAAVVARQMGKPCVVGCEALHVEEEKGIVQVSGKQFREGDVLTLDGGTGEVMEGRLPLISPQVVGDLKTIMAWVDQVRRLGIRTNADTPHDAALARDFGAEGIGLCRTEHMFFAEERLPIMQKMILAKDRSEREKHLTELLPMQREDFKGIFLAMEGCPVTIRLLDPPLHEFLPKRGPLMVEISEMKHRGAPASEIQEKERLLARVEELHEFNPMLGLRGCRLGILFPEISRMQAQAIFEAACELARKKKKVHPEIMIPLVGLPGELASQKQIIDEIAKEVQTRYKTKILYKVGTMIEVPRAALVADQIAEIAEFFSFGTNDLTQMTFAFSRDDTVAVIKHYQKNHLLEKDPFATLDISGVGQLIEMAVRKGRGKKRNLKIGICGEHGGDPATVEFCHRMGLDYVSCSPYRVPIARLAAAHAVLQRRRH
ncbi:MAG: pyruvate, phosphate dikinase [Deltaproteobacteria bacterium]|nr:pyruvate, phosphate dikinase [Deltaproteobacteria bacterium]